MFFAFFLPFVLAPPSVYPLSWPTRGDILPLPKQSPPTMSPTTNAATPQPPRPAAPLFRIPEIFATPPPPINFQDALYFLAVLASFAVGLAASWARWGHPVIDSGREMNVPLRLLRGELLYRDVRYIYGPLSPYLNAALYAIFHPSLWVLWGRGIVTTILILAITWWLARQILSRWPATLACLLLTWVCALKPQGNYILPYAYSALDGCLLGLAATAALILALRCRSTAMMCAAGLLAALAALAKTEMGLAALCTGVTAAFLAGYPRPASIARWVAIFLAPALAIPTAVYYCFALRAGWHTLTAESWLFFSHIPWQLIHFNKLRFGLDRPWHSIWLMLASLARLAALAALLASGSLLAKSDFAFGTPSVSSPRRVAILLLVSSLALILTTSFALGDLGPLLPMPIILAALVLAGLRRFLRESSANHTAPAAGAVPGSRALGPAATPLAAFLLISVLALASLMRIVLRVSTGGALSSDLLPASIILFVYLWLSLLPRTLAASAAARRFRVLSSSVLVIALAATAVTLSVRYREKFTYPIVTPRGTMWTMPDIGISFSQALAFIDQHSRSGDAVAVMPEGTSLDFFADRRNPLRDEITIPGMLDSAGEVTAIAALESSRAPIVLIANRSTHEFGQTAFGVDYDQALMVWIQQHYRSCGVLGPDHNPGLQVGAPVFFIRAYCRP
jgi:hypothetical protein